MLTLADMSTHSHAKTNRTHPPLSETIQRSELPEFLTSHPLVVVLLRNNMVFPPFNTIVAQHFRTDYKDDARFGAFDYSQIMAHVEWLKKHFPTYQDNGDGYYLFVNGQYAGFHSGKTPDSSVSFMTGLAAGLLTNTPNPLRIAVDSVNKVSAEHIVAHFEKLIQLRPPKRKKSQQEKASQDGPSFSNAHDSKSPYEIIGIKPNSSDEELKAAYHQKIKLNHPDQVANMSQAIKSVAESETKKICAAYEEIKRSRRRK